MTGVAPDAVSRLVDYYEHAAARMQGLPMHNEALAVEAVGFREHASRLVGVIVTFGAMGVFVSLLGVPAAAASETSLPWIAAAVGGAVVVVAATLLGSRLADVVRTAGSNPGASHRVFD